MFLRNMVLHGHAHTYIGLPYDFTTHTRTTAQPLLLYLQSLPCSLSLKKKIFSYSWWPPLRGCVLLIPHLHLVLNNGHTVQLLTSLYSCSSILLYRLNTFSSTFNRSRMPTLLFTFSLLNTYHYEVRLLNNDTSFLKRSSLMTLLYQHFLLFILCIFLNSTFLTNTMH